MKAKKHPLRESEEVLYAPGLVIWKRISDRRRESDVCPSHVRRLDQSGIEVERAKLQVLIHLLLPPPPVRLEQSDLEDPFHFPSPLVPVFLLPRSI